ncbi:signal peptidase I [Terriglobus sp.]|uniref:signal peptidase I n=1 Tax=Terriglobus sp. TaxID=1889013 RepID=UPI003AFF8E55
MATETPTEHPVVATAPATPEERHETLPESLAGTAYVFVIGLFLMTFLFQNYAIPSGSMEKTLLIGDHVVVDRTTLAPQKFPVGLVHYRPVQRGDIIVFVKPNPEEPDLVLVKRAIGLPGDRLHLEHGILFRNGQRVDEPQISMPHDNGDFSDAYDPYRDDFPRNPPHGTTEVWAVDLPTHIQNGDLVVPDNVVFAMGDNRIGSLDSRFWGFVPDNNIMGRPMFVYWSFITPADQIYKTGSSASIAWFGHVLTHFFSDTRWSRTGHVIR